MTEELKDRLLETLRYPRYLLRTELRLEECPHDGHFTDTDPGCQECFDGQDCRWLLSVDEDSMLENQPLDNLVNVLGFAIESVESLIEEGQHDALCLCEACLWRKQADTLYGEIRCHPDLGAPPIPH